VSYSEDPAHLTWRTFVLGQGLRNLPPKHRLLVDLTALAAVLVFAAALTLVSHNSRAALTYAIGFGGTWLVVAFGRYWLNRTPRPRLDRVWRSAAECSRPEDRWAL
jgi:hypothetical protein